MATSESAPLTDAERDWLHARAAALGLTPEQVHTLPLTPIGGRMVLSTDPGASLVPLRPVRSGGGVFLAEAAHVAAGETLEITCPRGDPVRVVLGRLTTAPGARVTSHTHLTLEAATVVAASNGPIELLGKDGKTGGTGQPGDPGSTSGRKAGEDGHTGGEGTPGDPGPGGTLWFGEITGTLTVIAGGGNGGDGGEGGRGGKGADVRSSDIGGRGGGGGTGGRGGNAGSGGSVVIAYGKLADGAEIHPLARPNRPGRGGLPGEQGLGGAPQHLQGSCGRAGLLGRLGSAPEFAIRCTPQAPKP